MNKIMNRIVAKKTMGMLGSLVFFTICILAVVSETQIAIINAVLGPLALLIISLYGIKAVSGNFAKRTDILGDLKKDLT